MYSDLPVGTLFTLVEHGQQELWLLVETTPRPPRHGRILDLDPLAMTGVGREVQVGETIHRCVTKSRNGQQWLESRRAYVVKPGDVTWEPLMETRGFGRDPQPVLGLKGMPNEGQPIYHNVLHRRI